MENKKYELLFYKYLVDEIDSWRQPLFGSERYSKHLKRVQKKKKFTSYGMLKPRDGKKFPVETVERSHL